MNPKATPAQVKAAEAILGHHFSCRRYIESALTHPSATEGMPVSECYERLEFLGDSILGAIVAKELFGRRAGGRRARSAFRVPERLQIGRAHV